MTDALHQSHRVLVILLKYSVLADGIEPALTPNVSSLPAETGPSKAHFADLVCPLGLTDRIDILHNTRSAGQSMKALSRSWQCPLLCRREIHEYLMCVRFANWTLLSQNATLAEVGAPLKIQVKAAAQHAKLG